MRNAADTEKLSLLLALSIAANLAELMLPRIPLFPWIRIGFTHIFTIAVIVLYSPGEALRFTLLRTLLAGFVSGIPLTSFLFSGAGGITAVLVMGGLWKLFGKRGTVGLIGIGITGALAHNLTQLFIAYHLFVKQAVFLWQIPFLCLFSVVSGGLVGGLSFSVIGPLKDSVLGTEIQLEVPSVFTLKQRLGFPILIIVFIGVFFLDRREAFAILFFLLFCYAAYERVAPGGIIKSVFRFWGLFVWNILTNILFTPGRTIVWRITVEGIEQAELLSLRLVFCVCASVVYMRTSGLEFPLHFFSRFLGGTGTVKMATRALVLLPELAAYFKKNKIKTFRSFKGMVEEILRNRSV
jgi:heptaprenyl diphosphate synthase